MTAKLTQLQRAESQLSWALGRIEDYRQEAAKLENDNAELVKAMQILEDALTRNGSETIAVRVARKSARALIAKHKKSE